MPDAVDSMLKQISSRRQASIPDDKKIEIYQRSLAEINRLDGLVNNILLARSIENENYFLNKQEVNLKSFIEERIALLENSILKSHKIELYLEEVTIAIDPLGFESILINLIENTKKYSESNSTIKIHLSQKTEGALFQITDEGIGIPKEKRELVFSKFYREENEMTRKSKGTGLGLYITKFLVEQHNGRIELKGNKPQGLIVAIEFKK